ncbi:hypothetical protein ACFFMN_23930 [Planobispora siamensis]|uniref:Uncharacterized protein n=1 Tax=Planobispora siamensis TaxID=936338 RepID=A0A8J3WP96_9ACTN|nr:hypothetical protein [Planobispora siamensis]GIH95387.1 hypothetical protein Psi01_60170 [Planobispora siamensis]
MTNQSGTVHSATQIATEIGDMAADLANTPIRPDEVHAVLIAMSRTTALLAEALQAARPDSQTVQEKLNQASGALEIYADIVLNEDL